MTRRVHFGLFLIAGLLCLAAVSFDAIGSSISAFAQSTFAQSKKHVPEGLPVSLWRKRIPADNPMSAEKIELGEALYFDKRLSVDETLSCASCHDPANAFTDHNPVAVGARNKRGARNAPTVLNAMFSETLFWDGRARSLEEQAKQPLINPAEMGMRDFDAVVSKVASIPEYAQRFHQVFKTDVRIDAIAKAIAAYERTRLSGDAPFDRFIGGEKNAITKAQKRGWDLFQHKAQCINCHTFNRNSPFFTDFKFHNTGVATKGKDFEELIKRTTLNKTVELGTLAHADDLSDLGRYLVTRQAKDIGAFKTPTLRDIELTTPFMHDGSHKTLLDVVRFYNLGGNANPYLDERIRPLNLTDQEMNDLVEFMRSLTSDEVLRQTQIAKPQTRTPFNASPRLDQSRN
jgi:cytochrome c peroxidase